MAYLKLALLLFLTIYTNFAQQPNVQPNVPHSQIPQSSPQQQNITVPAPQNHTEQVPAPQNMSVPVPAPQNMSEPVPAPQNMSVPVPAPQNMSEPVPAPQNMSVPVPAPQNLTVPGPQHMSVPAPQNHSNVPQPHPRTPQPAPNPPPEPVPPITSFIFAQFHEPDTGGPRGRSNAVMGIAANGKTVVVLGGNTRGLPAENNWEFDIQKQLWSPFPIVSNFSRVFACSSQGPDQDTMWIYGGRNGTSDTRSLNQFHIHDKSFQSFPEAPTSAPSIDVACAVMHKNKDFVIFGGSMPNGECSNQITMFKEDTHSWEVLHPKDPNAPVPAPRKGAVAVNYKDNFFVMFGGGCGNVTFSDTWRFDLQNLTWTKDNQIGDLPSGRMFANAEIYSANLYVFGGMHANESAVTDLTYVYDVDDYVWSRLTFKPSPSPRSRLSIAKSTNRLVIFGGSNFIREYNDIWQFVIEQNCFILNCHQCLTQPGCGWCGSNADKYQCIAATPTLGAYIPHTCLTTVSFHDSECPTDPFPNWAVGVIIVGGLVLVGFVAFVLVKLRTKVSFEQVK